MPLVLAVMLWVVAAFDHKKVAPTGLLVVLIVAVLPAQMVVDAAPEKVITGDAYTVTPTVATDVPLLLLVTVTV